MPYSVRIASFEGPLDLLLQLIEADKLEITQVALAQVTEPFLEHVQAKQGTVPPEELADFLVVAAKLIYLKSKALLPEIHDPSLEEGPDLETQLRRYQRFAEAARRLGELALSGQCSYSRPRPLRIEPNVSFMPPSELSPADLQELYQRVLKRLMPLLRLPQAAVERAVTIEEKIHELRKRVERGMRFSLHRFLASAESRQEVIVSFLALLELMKQRWIQVRQPSLFTDIEVQPGEASPSV